MDDREEAIVRAVYIHAPEDARVKALCEEIGYGAVMDSAARQWAQKDSMGALYVGGCLECRDLEAEAKRIRTEALNELAAMGQDADAMLAARAKGDG